MIWSTSPVTASDWLTSPVHVSARRPDARICSAVPSTSRHPAFFSSSGYVDGSRPVPVTTTSAPWSASVTAVALPIPRNRPAPVTSATLPSNAPMSWSSPVCASDGTPGRVPEALIARLVGLLVLDLVGAAEALRIQDVKPVRGDPRHGAELLPDECAKAHRAPPASYRSPSCDRPIHHTAAGHDPSGILTRACMRLLGVGGREWYIS